MPTEWDPTEPSDDLGRINADVDEIQRLFREFSRVADGATSGLVMLAALRFVIAVGAQDRGLTPDDFDADELTHKLSNVLLRGLGVEPAAADDEEDEEESWR